MWIKQIDLTDAGDGSTSIVITMTNGGKIYINEDIPYGAKVIIPFDANGNQQPREIHEYNHDTDQWEPDEYAD